MNIVTSYYNGGRYLDSFLNSVSMQTIAPKLNLSICLNMPSNEDLEKLTNFKKRFSGTTRVIAVDSLEPVSVSMNRCADNFFGFAHAIWNVDDLRSNNSLELQLESLKSGSDLAFGDYVCVGSQGQFEGNKVSYSGLTKEQYAERMMGGPFLAFTNTIFQEVMGFDEQFKIASDMDFYLKCMNLNQTKISYIDQNLGFYLDEGAGLSTNSKLRKQLAQERLVIRARFPRVKRESFDIGLLRSFFVLPYLATTKKMRIPPGLDRSWVWVFSRFVFFMIFFNTYSRFRQKFVSIVKLSRKISF